MALEGGHTKDGQHITAVTVRRSPWTHPNSDVASRLGLPNFCLLLRHILAAALFSLNA